MAFCRATTCDIEAIDARPECAGDPRDENSCSLSGAQLYWPTQCVGFGVQKDGSQKFDISWQTTDALVQRAFIAWKNVDCGGGRRPSLEVYDLDYDADKREAPMDCSSVEFNTTGTNANIWMYSDDEWPHDNAIDTLALTSVTFDLTGRILDADVEINSFEAELTTSDSAVADDLESIIMHETGHFLGLSHETLRHATMNPAYDRGTVDFRSLEADDVAGICATYPPDRDAPECPGGPRPPHGFSRYCADDGQTGTVKSQLSTDHGFGCACSFDNTRGRTRGSWFILCCVLAGLARRRFTKTTRGDHD